MVLNGGAHPPGGVGGETHVTIRLKTGCCFHQADMAFLHQISHGQTIMAKTGGQSDDEAHMGMCQPVKGLLVPLLTPLTGEKTLLFALQIGCVQRSLYKLTSEVLNGRHVKLLKRNAVALLCVLSGDETGSSRNESYFGSWFHP